MFRVAIPRSGFFPHIWSFRSIVESPRSLDDVGYAQTREEPGILDNQAGNPFALYARITRHRKVCRERSGKTDVFLMKFLG